MKIELGCPHISTNMGALPYAVILCGYLQNTFVIVVIYNTLSSRFISDASIVFDTTYPDNFPA